MIALETPWLETLGSEECLERIATAKIGRIGFVTEGMPTILPVNFRMVEGAIVFRTNQGTKLSWLTNHKRVAFEVDEVRHADKEGWSVLVRGTAHEVTDPKEVERLNRGPIPAWLPTAHWVRIDIEAISGRAVHTGRSHAGDP